MIYSQVMIRLRGQNNSTGELFGVQVSTTRNLWLMTYPNIKYLEDNPRARKRNCCAVHSRSCTNRGVT